MHRTFFLLALWAASAAAESAIVFHGELGLKAAQIRKALRATRSRTILPGIPGLWKGWRLQPDYSEAAAQSDAGALRSLYYQRGYFDAAVAVKPATITGGEAHIRFTVKPGTRYAIRQVDGRGNQAPGTEIPIAEVCRELLHERRDAEETGVLDFVPLLQLRDSDAAASNDPRHWVDGTTDVRPGPAYQIRRIEFRGNHHFRDRTLRRVLRIEEGAPLDSQRIRQSLARLNRTGWFQALSPADVKVSAAPGSDLADVTIQLQETRPGFWSFSGPVGPLSLGPLQFSAGMRLPGWGRGILELSTYAVSANLMLLAKPLGALIPFLPNQRFLRVLAIERPLLPGHPWLSGLVIAPQFGWPGVLAGYGVEHARGWIRSWPDSEGALTPGLPVIITHNGSAGMTYCQPPRTKIDRARQFASMAAGAVLSFAPL